MRLVRKSTRACSYLPQEEIRYAMLARGADENVRVYGSTQIDNHSDRKEALRKACDVTWIRTCGQYCRNTLLVDLLNFPLAILYLCRQTLTGLHDVAATSVTETNVDDEAVAMCSTVFQFQNRFLYFRRQFFSISRKNVNSDISREGFHTKSLCILGEDGHEGRHFKRITRPIFRRKGIDRNNLNTSCH